MSSRLPKGENMEVTDLGGGTIVQHPVGKLNEVLEGARNRSSELVGVPDDEPDQNLILMLD